MAIGSRILGKRNFEKDIDRVDTELSANIAGLCYVIPLAVGFDVIAGTTPRTLRHSTAFQLDTGGNARGTAAVDEQLTRALDTQVASGNNSTIGGGGRNTASGQQSTVAGGWLNTASGADATIGGGLSNTATPDLSTIAGGNSNAIATQCNYGFIGGGDGNDISRSAANLLFYNTLVGGLNNLIEDAQYCTLGGGDANTIRGTGGTKVSYNTVGGGQSNVIENVDGATISGGLTNQANADYATVPGGRYANADKYGQQAYASGRFAAVGDAQTSKFVARRSVTHSDTNWYELFLNSSSERMTIAADTVWTFKIMLVGTTQGCTKSFGFEINGVIENDGGTTSLLASNVTTLYDTDDVAFDARVSADDTNDALLVEVQDDTSGGDVVRWVAVVETAEVTFPA